MKRIFLILGLVLSVILVNAQKPTKISKDGIMTGDAYPKTINVHELKTLVGIDTTKTIKEQFDSKPDTANVITPADLAAQSANLYNYVYSQHQVDSITELKSKTIFKLKERGSSAKATVAIANLTSVSATGLTDNTVILLAIETLPWAYTTTGFKFHQYAAGSYTADNENRVGLYSLSGSTYTLVASIANDANLWTATSNTTVSKSWTTPYTTTANEQLYIGLLYNNSAQTTAPTLAGVSAGGSLTNIWHTDFLGTTNFIVAQKGS